MNRLAHIDELLRPLSDRIESEPPRDGDTRTPYQRDRGRLIHSWAFRRLQGKTQVINPGEGDFHRTRMTHSLEVGQIGQGIVHHLRMQAQRSNTPLDMLPLLPNDDLILTACYAHDIGHPPYGHSGEKALHHCMQTAKSTSEKSCFEANAQTVRILSFLENYHISRGINPTRRTLLAVLKYPVVEPDQQEVPPKCYYRSERNIVDWGLEIFSPEEREMLARPCEPPRDWHRTLDASIMDLADEIAYSTHDMEDAVACGFITRDNFNDRWTDFCAKHPLPPAITVENYFGALFQNEGERKRFIGGLIHFFITSVQISQQEHFQHPLLQMRAQVEETVSNLLDFLRNVVYDLVIDRPTGRLLERRNNRMICGIFQEMLHDPQRLIPADVQEHYRRKGEDPLDNSPRLLCDYIASMTDAGIERLYHLLFTPGYGTSRDTL